MYTVIFPKDNLATFTTGISDMFSVPEEFGYVIQRLTKIYNRPTSVHEASNFLMQAKRPQCFAEHEVTFDKWDVNTLDALASHSFAVPVTVFDNGNHNNPVQHATPHKATLLFVCGTLLASSTDSVPADFDLVVEGQTLSVEGFTCVYRQRLLPVLKYASEVALSQDKRAIITIPGLGCGAFAGHFSGSVGQFLRSAILTLVSENISQLTGIDKIHFDPYRECVPSVTEFTKPNGEIITFVTSPMLKDTKGIEQLAPASAFGASDETHMMFSVVAWDHVSWPGNDFYIGNRVTDDGVKAAATDCMTQITGHPGVYNPTNNQYEPVGFPTWLDVVKHFNVKLSVTEHNFRVF